MEKRKRRNTSQTSGQRNGSQWIVLKDVLKEENDIVLFEKGILILFNLAHIGDAVWNCDMC